MFAARLQQMGLMTCCEPAIQQQPTQPIQNGRCKAHNDLLVDSSFIKTRTKLPVTWRLENPTRMSSLKNL